MNNRNTNKYGSLGPFFEIKRNTGTPIFSPEQNNQNIEPGVPTETVRDENILLARILELRDKYNELNEQYGALGDLDSSEIKHNLTTVREELIAIREIALHGDNEGLIRLFSDDEIIDITKIDDGNIRISGYVIGIIDGDQW